MRTAHRRLDPGLIDQLVDTPQRFDFFQAVRLLQQTWHSSEEGRSKPSPNVGGEGLKIVLNSQLTDADKPSDD